MAKKEVCTCPGCELIGTKLCMSLSLITLAAGVLFLLQDLGIWAFWNISWYSLAFILVGLVFVIANRK